MVEQDFSEAAYWFEQAANQGDEKCQYELGLCYLYGKGVEENIRKAAEWLSKSASNYAMAQHKLDEFAYGLERCPNCGSFLLRFTKNGHSVIKDCENCGKKWK